MEQTNETSQEGVWNKTSLNNVSIIENFEETESFVPQWIVSLYFVFISLGAAVNLIYCVALLRCRRNGTLSLIMQLCAVDFLFLYTVAIEVLTLRSHTWRFSPNYCPLFNGMETLINSLVLWLIICLDFHIISLWNLHKDGVEKKDKNPLTSCHDESDECLVQKTENMNRTLNIDYRKRKNDVSIIFPTLLIWFFCVSLSIPNFTLSLTMKIDGNYTVCAIVDNLYGHILQRILLILRVLLPMGLLIFALLILIKKLANTSKKDIDNVLTKKFDEIRSLLIFCITLTILYIITSFQRNVLQFLNLILHDFNKNTAIIFRLPPLYDDKLINKKSVYLSMLHYCGTTIRAFLYIYLLPKFAHLIKDRIFVCWKSENSKAKG